MKKENKKSLDKFWATLFAAAIGAYLGVYITDLFELHWALLGVLVLVIFLICHKLFLFLFSKLKK